MKGVVLTHAPAAQLVDLSNDVGVFDLTAAALILDASFSYFPKGTIHVTVIDPGVGSPRRHLLLEANSHTFIGPDNGILGRIARLHKGECFEIDPDALGAKTYSNTFHGRDIYALAAGKLLAKSNHKGFTKPVSDPVILELPEPLKTDNGFEGEVIYIDHFGNLVTNFRGAHYTKGARFLLGNKPISLKDNYSAIEPENPGMVLDSWGYYEIAFYGQNAADKLGLDVGSKIILNPPKPEEKV